MAGKKKKKQGDANITTNRKARHDFQVLEVFETGIVLCGTEVKSLRARKISLKDSFASFSGGELWLMNSHIEEYVPGNRFNHEPERVRKLLMKKRELEKLSAKVSKEGLTLIPLRFYFKGAWVKVEIGLCRGKKQYDRRDDITKREAKRQIERALKHNNQ